MVVFFKYQKRKSSKVGEGGSSHFSFGFGERISDFSLVFRQI